MPIDPSQLALKSLDFKHFKDGSVTDAIIGTRKVNEDTTLESNTGTIEDLLSELAKEIDVIKGNTGNWFDTPVATLLSLFNQDVVQSVSGYIVPNNGSFGRVPIYRDMILKQVSVSCSSAPTTATRIDVYKNTSLVGYFSISTQNTTWNAPANTNLAAGDMIYCKVNGTSGIKTAPNSTTIFFRLGNR